MGVGLLLSLGSGHLNGLSSDSTSSLALLLLTWLFSSLFSPPFPLAVGIQVRLLFDVRPNSQSQCFDILTLIRPKCCVFSNQTDNNGSQFSRPCTQAQTFAQYKYLCEIWSAHSGVHVVVMVIRRHILAYFLHSSQCSHPLSLKWQQQTAKKVEMRNKTG